jgi:ABC-type multidrug transport system fused ATPase/permease subunit
MLRSFSFKNPLSILLSTGWRYTGRYKPLMVFYFCLFALAEATALSEPYIIGKMLNCVQSDMTKQFNGEKLWHDLCLYLGLFFLISFLFWAFHGPARVIERFVAFHIRTNYKADLFYTLTQLPLQWHRDHHSGENIDKINRATTSLAWFFDNSFEVSYMLFRLLGSEIMLFCFLPLAGWVAMGTTVVSFFFIFLFDRYLYKQYEQLNKFENSVASAIHDYVTNIASVITLRLEDRVLKEVSRRMMEPLALFKNNITVHEVKWFITSMLIAVMTVLVLCYYAHGILLAGKVILAGTFFTLFEYLRRIGESFYNFAGLYGTVVRQSADVEGADSITQALATPIERSASAHLLPARWSSVRVSGLHFKYEDEQHREHHLADVHVDLAPGKSIALVGESGSGKSTLLSLLRGVQQTENVSVECDGKLLPDKLHHLSSSTTLIPQDPEIFADTIRFNITFGLKATDEDVMRAVRLARFEPVLKRLPNGLETNIAEKGVNLSGGEKQRLALARGFYFAKDSDIILLDEPTSSVDIHNERVIYDNLLSEFSGKCVVSSIHKLHLLDLFDEVYVFDDGRLVEQGPPEVLEAAGGVLAEMYRVYANEPAEESASDECKTTNGSTDIVSVESDAADSLKSGELVV